MWVRVGEMVGKVSGECGWVRYVGSESGYGISGRVKYVSEMGG